MSRGNNEDVVGVSGEKFKTAFGYSREASGHTSFISDSNGPRKDSAYCRMLESSYKRSVVLSSRLSQLSMAGNPARLRQPSNLRVTLLSLLQIPPLPACSLPAKGHLTRPFFLHRHSATRASRRCLPAPDMPVRRTLFFCQPAAPHPLSPVRSAASPLRAFSIVQAVRSSCRDHD